MSSRHEDIVILLRKMNVENIESKINQVLSILSVKNLVEYEDREFRENDALKIVAQAERLYAWVKRFLCNQKQECLFILKTRLRSLFHAK